VKLTKGATLAVPEQVCGTATATAAGMLSSAAWTA